MTKPAQAVTACARVCVCAMRAALRNHLEGFQNCPTALVWFESWPSSERAMRASDSAASEPDLLVRWPAGRTSHTPNIGSPCWSESELWGPPARFALALDNIGPKQARSLSLGGCFCLMLQLDRGATSDHQRLLVPCERPHKLSAPFPLVIILLSSYLICHVHHVQAFFLFLASFFTLAKCRVDTYTSGQAGNLTRLDPRRCGFSCVRWRGLIQCASLLFYSVRRNLSQLVSSAVIHLSYDVFRSKTADGTLASPRS